MRADGNTARAAEGTWRFYIEGSAEFCAVVETKKCGILNAAAAVTLSVSSQYTFSKIKQQAF
jgi:hypothetical protein